MLALAMLQNQPVRRPTYFRIAKFPQADLNLSCNIRFCIFWCLKQKLGICEGSVKTKRLFKYPMSMDEENPVPLFDSLPYMSSL